MKKATSPRAAVAQLEALESRLLLSGTVTVSLVSGTLNITGDVSDNHISLLQTAPGAYTIAGLEGTLVKKGASILASQQVTGATKDISIDMSVGAVNGNAGNDTVELAGDLHVGNVNLTTLQGTRGNFTFKGSAGNDQLFLGGTPATASLTFNANPADGDTVQLTDALGNVQTMEFDTGALHNANDLPVAIGANAAATLTNFRAVLEGSQLHLSSQLTSSTSCQLMSTPGTAGNQLIVVVSVDIAGNNFVGGTDYDLDAQNVTVNMGDGSNVLTLGSLSTTPVNFASTIHGNLSVTGGKGANLVVPANVTVHGNLSAKLGDGNNKLDFVSTADAQGEDLGRVDGNVDYSGGNGGEDSVEFDNTEIGGYWHMLMGTYLDTDGNEVDAEGTIIDGDVKCTFGGTGQSIADLIEDKIYGKLTLSATGAGNDTTDLSGSHVFGTTMLSLGAGDNTLTAGQFNGRSARFEGPFSVAITNAKDFQNLVDLLSANFESTLSITAGASNNTINLGGVNVIGKTTLALGSGANDVEAATLPTFGGAFSYTSTGGAPVTNTINFTTPSFGGSVSVTTGASNDTIDLGGANITGQTTLNLGGGNNDVEGSTQATFGGAFSYTATSGAGDTNILNLVSPKFDGAFSVMTGASDDTVNMNGAQVAGNAKLNEGAGNNTFDVLGALRSRFCLALSFTATVGGNNTVAVGSAAGKSEIGGAFTVATGSGNDTIGFYANVGGNLSINTGTSLTGDTITGSGGTITGTAGIATGNTAGTSAVNLLNMTFLRSATLGLGTGTNNVGIQGGEFCRLGGSFSLTGGIGLDNISIATAASYASPTTFWRGVNVHLLGGSDTLKIGASTSAGGTGDANTYARFLSAASASNFYAGAGANNIYYQFELNNPLLPVPNQFLLAPVINTYFLF